MRAVAVPDAVTQAKMSEGEGRRDVAGRLPSEHAAVLGRVAMALLGDTAQVERVLEQVAREAGSKPGPVGVKPLVWLLGLVRAASATHLSKLPLRTRSAGIDAPPNTQRMGVALAAAPARAALSTLKPTEREAVILMLVGGLDAADVAAACNVDVGTAKTRISRGLEQLVMSSEGARADEGGEV